jgi:Zn-dependent peptidase ImmA (M78 family)
VVVHRNILGELHYNTVQEWQQAMKAIPSEAYGRLEWQANSFAGHLLVPTVELRSNLKSLLAKIAEYPNVDPNDEGVRLIIEKRLADIFSTSSMTVHIRLEKEGL